MARLPRLWLYRSGEMYFRFTGGFGNASVRVVLLDVHADFGAREVGLHVSGAFGLLHFDALILRGALLLERFDFLVGDFTVREHGDHVFRENHVLNVDAFWFRPGIARVADGCDQTLRPGLAGASR